MTAPANSPNAGGVETRDIRPRTLDRDREHTPDTGSPILRGLLHHLILLFGLFPTYPLTFYASGSYYRAIYDIAIPARSQPLPAIVPNVRRENELKKIHDDVTSTCLKAHGGSLIGLIICIKVVGSDYARSEVAIQSLLLVGILRSLQGVYVASALKKFMQSVYRPNSRSPIEDWSADEKTLAATFMAYPAAFQMWSYMLAAIAVLCYFDNPSAAPLLEFIRAIGGHLHDVLRLLPSTPQSNALPDTLPALHGTIIVLLSLYAVVELAILQYVLRKLELKSEKGKARHRD